MKNIQIRIWESGKESQIHCFLTDEEKSIHKTSMNEYMITDMVINALDEYLNDNKD